MNINMPTTRKFGIIILFLIGHVEVAKANGDSTNAKKNNRPIIAILSQEITHGLLPPRIKALSYIAASYVKFIESAGAQVVPITTTMSYQEIIDIFNSVNGVLFPGGDVSLVDSKYATNARRFYRLAMQANKRGDFFPIWGTCLGFEALACIAAGKDVLSHSNSVGIAIPLNFSNDVKSSAMMRHAPEELMKELSTKRLTYNSHRYCVTPETFSRTKELNCMFKVVSYNNDLDGKTFISTFEGTDLPIYATQWHPEANTFEWNAMKNIPHSKRAIEVTQYFANFFVNKARKSQHSFKSKEEEGKYLIYRYRLAYTGDAGYFEECYVFN